MSQLKREVFLYNDPKEYQKGIAQLQTSGWQIEMINMVISDGSITWVVTCSRLLPDVMMEKTATRQ